MTTDAAKPALGELEELRQFTVSLREALTEARFPFELRAAARARLEARDLGNQLDDHILPRLADIDAPALIVVGGSTGSGKSTIVNSLIGTEVTKPGVLRPTTRSPVLVCHPAERPWFADQRLLPGLARIEGAASSSTSELQLVTTELMPRSLALIDAPDVDSVEHANRELAAQLLNAADVWVFVTTAARYADAVPWEFLKQAQRRGTELAMVLNRVPPGTSSEIRSHLGEMLRAQGLGGSPIFDVTEQDLVSGLIPLTAVESLRSWIGTLSVDKERRATAVRRTLVGALAEMTGRVEELAEHVDEQAAVVTRLNALAGARFDAATKSVVTGLNDGDVLKGEVLARWQDVVGTGELLRQLQSALGRVRDRITSALRGLPTKTEQLEGAVESSLVTLVRGAYNEANALTYREWRADQSGAAVLAANPQLSEQPQDLAGDIERMVRDWQGGILELVRTEGQDKRTAARALSYGVNGVALVAMMTVFTSTGGLTGAEVAIAGGTSAAGHKVLEAVLGDQAVRRLAERARSDLTVRLDELMDSGAQRFTSTTEQLVHSEVAAQLRDAAIAIEAKTRTSETLQQLTGAPSSPSHGAAGDASSQPGTETER